MSNALQPRIFGGTDEKYLIRSLQDLLDQKHAQFLAGARRHWEKNFAGKDASDACVTVRIARRTLPSPRPTPVHQLQTV